MIITETKLPMYAVRHFSNSKAKKIRTITTRLIPKMNDPFFPFLIERKTTGPNVKAKNIAVILGFTCVPVTLK